MAAVGLTQEEWIERAEIIHGKGTYDYSEIDFKDGKTKVKIKCNNCGEYFYQSFHKHVTYGHGCRNCRTKKYYNDLRNTEKKKWIEKVAKKWGNKLEFPNAEEEYINVYSKITVRCKICGTVFKASAEHLGNSSTQPCPTCFKKYYTIKRSKSLEDFIKEAEKVHGKGEYDYSKAVYKGVFEPILIIDPKMNNEEFWQTPHSHLRGCGNPNRSSSRGERLIANWLDNNNITFKKEVSQDKITKTKRSVKIDFCLLFNSKEYWIEYNGIQHYKSVKFSNIIKDEEQQRLFSEQVERDKKVRDFCKENNITLIEIPYTYNTLESISDILNKVIIEGIDPSTIIDIPEVEEN